MWGHLFKKYFKEICLPDIFSSVLVGKSLVLCLCFSSEVAGTTDPKSLKHWPPSRVGQGADDWLGSCSVPFFVKLFHVLEYFGLPVLPSQLLVYQNLLYKPSFPTGFIKWLSSGRNYDVLASISLLFMWVGIKNFSLIIKHWEFYRF